MTNIEAWKTMSIQEAADTLSRQDYCLEADCKTDKFCFDCAKEWLEREATE